MNESERRQASPGRQAELSALAQHARRRYSLYRAKTHSSRATSPGRLRELKRAAELAEARAARLRY